MSRSKGRPAQASRDVKPASEMTDREAFLRMWELTARPGNCAREMAKLTPKAKRYVEKVAKTNQLRAKSA